MPEIAIVTDTDASLPPDIVAKYGIYEVPITVHFGDEVLQTGVDIDDTALFARVDKEGKLPTTSAPSLSSTPLRVAGPRVTFPISRTRIDVNSSERTTAFSTSATDFT